MTEIGMTEKKILLARAYDERWASLGNVDFLSVLTVVQHKVSIPHAMYQAVILTSANAARPDLLKGFEDIPVYTVGDVTAHMAHKAGCKKVLSAKGTVQDLINLLVEKLDPRDGALLYLRGEETSMDLASVLLQETLVVNEVIVYSTQTAQELPENIKKSFESNSYAVVGVFSARGAQVLDALLEPYSVKACTLTGLSSACIIPLQNRQWKQVSPSLSPTFQTLYDHISTI